VSGQLALDAPEFFQVLERHAVKAILGAQGIDAVFGMAGVVHKVVGLVPRPPFDCEHDPVDRRHDFSQGRRPAPMTGRSPNHCMRVHQRDKGPGHHRVGQRDVLPGGVLDLHGIFRALGWRGGQPVGQIQGTQRGNIDGFHGSDFSGHGLAP